MGSAHHGQGLPHCPTVPRLQEATGNRNLPVAQQTALRGSTALSTWALVGEGHTVVPVSPPSCSGATPCCLCQCQGD